MTNEARDILFQIIDRYEVSTKYIHNEWHTMNSDEVEEHCESCKIRHELITKARKILLD